MLPTKKQFLFSIVPASLLLALLVILEISLRLFVPSLSIPLLRVISVDGQSRYQVNRRYLEKYFPANTVLVPELQPSLIRTEKGEDLFRVFCLGESSMFGTPYELSATIPALVRTQLRHMFPGKEIEVVNLAASAINTNVIADLAPPLAALKPDVVLLYTGHNEFYGPDGIGAPWIERELPFLTEWKYRARDLRIVRLAQRALGAIMPRPAEEDRNMMKEVSRGAAVELQSPGAERVFNRLRKNLHKILETFHRSGIPVIASEVSSNLMFAPFAHHGRADLAWLPAALAEGKYEDVLGRLSSLRSGDSTDALIDYWLGRTYLKLGNTGAAADFLQRARDEDLLKFRAPGETNTIIRAVCLAEGTPCISTDSLLSSCSPSGITGGTLFWEHLHPNVRGYDLIARLFLGEMLSLRLLPSPDSAGVPPLLPFSADSLNLCWLDLAYGEISVKGLTGRWPFTGFASPSPLFDSAGKFQRQIVLDIYNKKIGWPEACLKFADYSERSGNPREAERTYCALIGEYPYEFYPHYRLARLFKETGETRRAEHEYGLALSLNPLYPYTSIDLGLLENNAGDLEAAHRHLTAALALTEGKDLSLPRAEIYYGLAAVSANSGDIRTARALTDTALMLAPSYLAARQLRQQLLLRK